MVQKLNYLYYNPVKGKWNLVKNYTGYEHSSASFYESNAGEMILDHFVDLNKMVELGSGSKREIEDIALTRYACYLIAQNGDSSKPPVAFAETYFAVQTRKQEIIGQRLLDIARTCGQ